MNAVRFHFAFLFILATLGFSAQAEDFKLSTKLGKLGKLQLSEDFSGSKVPNGWRTTFGELAVKGEKLTITQLEKDKHAAAIRFSLPIQDCVVCFEHVLNGCKFLHFGFDPAKGELDKKGHLFSVVFKPTSISILHHHDKADPDAKSKVLAIQKYQSDTEKPTKVVIENRGTKVRVHVNGKVILEASNPEFAVKKPGLVFRVSGPEDRHVEIDNVRVWEYAQIP